jgi:hypothetical protein
MGFQSQPTTDSISCHTMGFTAQPTFRAHTPGPPLHCPIPPSHAPPATPPNPDPPPPPPPPRRRCRGGHLPSGPPPDGSPLPAVRLPPRPPSPGPQARRGDLCRAARLLGAALGRQGVQGRACPRNRLRAGERPGGRQQSTSSPCSPSRSASSSTTSGGPSSSPDCSGSRSGLSTPGRGTSSSAFVSCRARWVLCLFGNG